MESRGKEEERQGAEEEGKKKEDTPPRGRRAKKSSKGVTICGMMKVNKTKHQCQRKDAMRNYTTQHVPGTHLNFNQRQILASDWNAIIKAGGRITLRQFAAKHGLKCETWRREYLDEFQFMDKGSFFFGLINEKDVKDCAEEFDWGVGPVRSFAKDTMNIHKRFPCKLY